MKLLEVAEVYLAESNGEKSESSELFFIRHAVRSLIEYLKQKEKEQLEFTVRPLPGGMVASTKPGPEHLFGPLNFPDQCDDVPKMKEPEWPFGL